MSSDIYVELLPGDVNYVNRILEGYEYLGVLTTIDPRKALVKIRAVPDTRDEVLSVLRSLPVALHILTEEECMRVADIR
jgi:hypothetical protein